MKDLASGSIYTHIVTMAAPIAVALFTQTAYQLVDLYFITKVGVAATAGVNAAGTTAFVVSSLAQVLAVGTAALIAQAVGRADRTGASAIFNQALLLSLVCATATTGLMYSLIRRYMEAVAADSATIEAGVVFVKWSLLGVSLVFPGAVLASALRGTGIVGPTTWISILSVVLNAILAPVLIAGWGTGHALGVRGAGLASSISTAAATVALALYFQCFERYLLFDREQLRPVLKLWYRLLAIGVPAGGELLLLFVFTGALYYATRKLGVDTQAGIGIGARVLQLALLPALAIGISVGPIAGQNFGAERYERVKETFRKSAMLGAVIMVVVTALAQWQPRAFVVIFNANVATISVAMLFVRTISWGFVAEGVVVTCSSMFQGMGNTFPALVGSVTRVVVFSVAAVWLGSHPNWGVKPVLYVAVVAVILHAMISVCLLKVEFRKKLAGELYSSGFPAHAAE